MLQSRLIEFAPFPLRIIAGIGFMIHGLPKILDIGKTQGSFTNMGVPPDLAILIGLLEFIGGLAILLGFLNKNCSRVTSNRDDRFYSISENIKRIYRWF
jgi:putative oxidoreductase